ncbi:hypothetical protein OF83DRAFT_1177726 [Amylostereum chailletii]|nr:hypothetical protein OF83DRAFT_1177726 [Amylostereum chailletii]
MSLAIKSELQMDDVPSDQIHLYIFTFLSIRDLLSLCIVSKQLQVLVQDHLEDRLTSFFGRWVHKVPHFRLVLRLTGGIVGGSALLSLLSKNEDWGWWETDLLDIFAPKGSASTILSHLLQPESEEYTVISEIPPTIPSLVVGVEYIYQLRRADSTCINVTITTFGPPSLSLTHCGCTLLMNFLTADTLYVPYPKYTFSGIAFYTVEPSSPPEFAQVVAAFKYLGYSWPDTLPPIPHEHTPWCREAHCMGSYRTFHDLGGLRVSMRGDGMFFRAKDEGVMWRFGVLDGIQCHTFIDSQGIVSNGTPLTPTLTISPRYNAVGGF